MTMQNKRKGSARIAARDHASPRASRSQKSSSENAQIADKKASQLITSSPRRQRNCKLSLFTCCVVKKVQGCLEFGCCVYCFINEFNYVNYLWPIDREVIPFQSFTGHLRAMVNTLCNWIKITCFISSHQFAVFYLRSISHITSSKNTMEECRC